MNQVFASGQQEQGSGENEGYPEEMRIQNLERQMGLAVDLLGELKELLAEEPPARPLRRSQRTRPRVRGGHLPHGVKFYVIGGGLLALLAGVAGLPHDNPVKVVVVRTADYLVQQLPNLPANRGPAVAGLVSLPVWGSAGPSKVDSGDPKQPVAAQLSPSPSVLSLSPGRTVAAVASAAPVSGLDPGPVTVAATSSSSTPPPPTIPPTSLPLAPPPAPAPPVVGAVVDPAPPPATPAPTTPPTPAPTPTPTAAPTSVPPTAPPTVVAVPPPTPVASSSPSPSPTP